MDGHPLIRRFWGPLPKRTQPAGFVLAVLAALLFGFTELHGRFACAGENTGCAYSTVKDEVYEGTLHRLDNSIYEDGPFEMRFASGDRVEFEAGADGHYCFVWASERIVASALTPSGDPLYGRRDSYGNVETVNPARGTAGGRVPPGCEDKGSVSWDRADGVESTWQFQTLRGLVIAALVLLIAALCLSAAQPGRATLALGTALLLVAGLLTVVL